MGCYVGGHSQAGNLFNEGGGQLDSPKWLHNKNKRERGPACGVWPGFVRGSYGRKGRAAETTSSRGNPRVCATDIGQAAASISWLTTGNRISRVGCRAERSGLFRLTFPRLLQSFARAIHARPSRLSVGNGPLGLWEGLYVESRSRGTEEKGQSPQRLRAVDTPLAVDCGSCVIPFPSWIPTFVPQPSAQSQVPS